MSLRLRHLAIAGLAAAMLTACGGSGDTPNSAAGSTSAKPSGNGEAQKKGSEVVADAADALQKAGSARIVGTTTSGGQQVILDLHVQGSDVSGTLGPAGQTVELLATGGKFYMRAPAAFWTSQGMPQQATPLFDNKWVLVPAEQSAEFASFSLEGLTQEMRKPTEGATVQDKVTTETLDGKPVVVVSQSDGSKLYVAAEGEPYPLKFDNKGKEPGSVTLSDFGKKVSVTAPTDVVDLSKLAGG